MKGPISLQFGNREKGTPGGNQVAQDADQTSVIFAVDDDSRSRQARRNKPAIIGAEPLD